MIFFFPYSGSWGLVTRLRMVGGHGEFFCVFTGSCFFFFRVCGSKMVWDWVVNFFACLSICFTGSISLSMSLECLSFSLRFAGWDASSVGVSGKYCKVNHAPLVKLKYSGERKGIYTTFYDSLACDQALFSIQQITPKSC